ncbi:MAG: hypothetical protein JXR83_23110 [Deltaproteobacteria bacterium]|nr:hypothetical protein [Deltaproteobacteria bacterium]
MATIETPELAIRLARAIASDISLYNEEKIADGIKNDRLFDAIETELAEGRELYLSRIAPQLAATSNYFDRAVVDVILRAKGHIRSKLW